MRLLHVLVLLWVCNAYAQDFHTLEGQVFDEKGTPVSVCDVLLLRSESNTLEQYTTVLDGEFILEDVPTGDYILQISALGFAMHQEKFLLNTNRIFSITLKENATALSGVEVVAAKNPIEYKGGNLKVDVQNPFFSSIPDAMDLLSRLPNVQVSPDRESVSILGKGTPLIYLNNQRISMEEFGALSVDGIATIELINNPSAKYEAEGRAVLRVTLKNDVNSGLQGSLTETASARRNFNNYLGFASSFSNEKLTIRGNLAYNQLQQWESNSFLFEIPERDVLVDYLVLIPRNDRVQINGGLGLYFQWNDSDYLSFNSTLRAQTDDAPFFTDTFLVDRDNEEFIETRTGNDNTKDYYTGSFNFNKKLTDTWNLFTGVQYSGFKQTLDTEITNSVNNLEFMLDQTRAQEYSINSFAFRVDVEKTFSEHLKLELGANISRAKADAFTEIQQVSTNTETLIDFGYEEELLAGYSSISGKIGEKTSFETGLRAEFNTVDGTIASEDSPIVTRNNTNLFPKANFSFALDSTKTLSFNYARSIQRPDFSRASSITAFINPFLEGTGNVNLRPTLTNEVSTNYQKGNKSFFITYYQSANPTNFTISYDAQADTALLSLVNLEKENGFYAGATLPYSKGIWTSNNTITLNYNQLKDQGATISSAKPYIYVYTNHQLKIAKDTTLALGAYAIGRRQEGIFRRNGRAVFEASLSKTFFKKWDCALRFNDITRAMNFEEQYALNGVIADGVYFADAREMAFSVKYRFGSSKSANFKNKDVDENLNRIN